MHDRGLKIYGGTLTPFLGALYAEGQMDHHSDDTERHEEERGHHSPVRLVEKRLISRKPGRGRVVGHLLTAEGEAVPARSNAVVDDALRDAFACLSASECRSLLLLTKRLVERGPTSARAEV